MVSKLTLHFMANSLLPPAGFPKRRMHKPKNPCVLAVVSRPASASGVESSSSPSTSSSPSSKNVYVDNWFDHFAINHLSKNLQSATGNSTSTSNIFLSPLLFLTIYIYIFSHFLLSLHSISIFTNN